MNSQVQAIDGVITHAGLEAIIIRSRGIEHTVMPRQRSVHLTDSSIFLKVISTILCQGQAVDRVAPRGCPQTIVIDTRFGIGLAVPRITAIGIHRGSFVVEIRRCKVNDEAVDTIATIMGSQGIVVDTGLCNGYPTLHVCSTRTDLHIVFTILRLQYRKSQYIDGVGTMR